MRLLVIGNIETEVSKAIIYAKNAGAEVSYAKSIVEALASLNNGKGADLIFCDVSNNMKTLILSLKEHFHSIPVIAIGIDAKPDEIVAAIKAGAKEYLPLPPDEVLIKAIIETICNSQNEIVANSTQMKNILELVAKIAKADATVLITGKSGCGKEVMCRYIHNSSNRSKKAFVSVNCAAIPENLIESELFGHEKGAFTGALSRRIGKFEEANNGTILLDEISEISPHIQAKLLRVIQEKELTRLGGNDVIKLNIRILATSNRDLKNEVKNGNFREDLYYRLNVININLPELRDRKEDILPLSSYFVEKYCKELGMQVKQISNEAEKLITSYHWPGNVRELENAIYRAVLLSNDIITEQNLQITANQQQSNNDEEAILETYKEVFGDNVKAARILGISLANLNKRLAEFNHKKTAN